MLSAVFASVWADESENCLVSSRFLCQLCGVSLKVTFIGIVSTTFPIRVQFFSKNLFNQDIECLHCFFFFLMTLALTDIFKGSHCISIALLLGPPLWLIVTIVPISTSTTSPSSAPTTTTSERVSF